MSFHAFKCESQQTHNVVDTGHGLIPVSFFVQNMGLFNDFIGGAKASIFGVQDPSQNRSYSVPGGGSYNNQSQAPYSPTAPYVTSQGRYANYPTYVKQTQGQQVLGAAQAPSGGGGGTPPAKSLVDQLRDMGYNPFSENNAADIMRGIEEQQNRLRGEITSGWDSYIGDINNLADTGLNEQRAAQENIAKEQYTLGQDKLNTQKSRSLKDVAENMRNAFQAGNIYLGSLGAGDSSAANQYSFALNKQGNKQISNINETVNTNLAALQSQYDQQISQIATWFSDAQNQLKQMAATGKLNKAQDLSNMSKDLLNRAIGEIDRVKTEASNRKNALMEWAMNNSTNMAQLSQTVAGIPQGFDTPQVMSNGTAMAPTGLGFGNSDERNKNQLFQNPSWFS